MEFSIIIPTYNRPAALANCLKALSNLSFPREQYEVIVVDDGGQVVLDPTIETFQAQMALKLLRQTNAGPAAARNYGASRANGRYLAFTDDDCMPDRLWLEAFAGQFVRTPEALLGGKAVNSLTQNPFAAASQALIDILYQHFNQGKDGATFFTSNNMAMPRHLFHRVGGFDTSFPLSAGEDRDLCDRWLSAQFPMHYAPVAVVNHAHGLTAGKFWRQHFNYGRGAVLYHRMRTQRGSGTFTIDRRFHLNARYWLIDPLLKTKAWYRWLMPLLLVGSQIANLAGFLHERRAQRDSLHRAALPGDKERGTSTETA